MFFNEGISKDASGKVSIPVNDGKKLFEYDLFDLTYMELDRDFDLILRPYESKVYILAERFPTELEGSLRKKVKLTEKKMLLEGDWKISYCEEGDLSNRILLKQSNVPEFISSIDGYQRKSGTAFYEVDFDWDGGDQDVILKLGEVFETAEVIINGQNLKPLIAPPYDLDIGKALREGKNHLTIAITNTLGTQVRDYLSQYLPIEPFGLDHIPQIEY